MEETFEKLVRCGRRFQGEVWPYFAVTVTEHPSTPPAGLLKRIGQMSGSPEFDWLLACSTSLQRPLYIGKAKNLRVRILEHISGASDLRGDLEEMGLALRDCAVVFLELPVTKEGIAGTEDEDPPVLRLAESLLISVARPTLNERR